MRGQITAIAFLVLGLVSTTLGNTLVGALTDYLFCDPNAVRSSAVIVAIFASILGSYPCAWACMPMSEQQRKTG
jgi:phage shock protein PspC (stress-responsive transcriptional regulator)